MNEFKRLWGKESGGSWDPLVCENCGGRMSPPSMVGGQYMNRCTRCGRTRSIPSGSPMLQQELQNFPAYPQALQDVGADRPWMTAGKITQAKFVP